MQCMVNAERKRNQKKVWLLTQFSPFEVEPMNWKGVVVVQCSRWCANWKDDCSNLCKHSDRMHEWMGNEWIPTTWLERTNKQTTYLPLERCVNCPKQCANHETKKKKWEENQFFTWWIQIEFGFVLSHTILSVKLYAKLNWYDPERRRKSSEVALERCCSGGGEREEHIDTIIIIIAGRGPSKMHSIWWADLNIEQKKLLFVKKQNRANFSGG